jgi:flagellar hook assembly protein FlgD
LAIDLPADGPLRVRIYDVAGRQIRELVATDSQSGRQTLVWDGTDDSGRTQPSGVYFAQASDGGTFAVCKIVLAR